MADTARFRSSAQIRVGIGGWTFEPWRSNFYPAGLAQSKELHYASRQLSAIEVNGTYYSTFKPSTFAKWHSETPDGFPFSLNADRHAPTMARAQRSPKRRLDADPRASVTLPLLMPYTSLCITAPAAASHGMCTMLPAFTRAMGARMMITITPAAT